MLFVYLLLLDTSEYHALQPCKVRPIRTSRLLIPPLILKTRRLLLNSNTRIMFFNEKTSELHCSNPPSLEAITHQPRKASVWEGDPDLVRPAPTNGPDARRIAH